LNLTDFIFLEKSINFFFLVLPIDNNFVSVFLLEK